MLILIFANIPDLVLDLIETESFQSITPKLSRYGTKTRIKFCGNCLRQDKATYNHATIVNIYIVYEISKNYNISIYPTLEKCLFGAITLTKHVDIDLC